MLSLSRPLRILLASGLPLAALAAEPRPWQIYLLFGQSNMAGGAASDAQDRVVHPRVKMLAYDNCPSQNRTYNQWYPASPHLHGCGTGVGLGDWFGRIVADSMKQDTIALIPCAIPGVDIDFFRKDVVSSRRGEFRIPPDNKATGAYPWMVERLKIAQKKGVIKGILLHQGEADWTAAARTAWPGKVAGILTDLKKDLGFGDVPFLVGELRRDGCCSAHNPYVATLAKSVPNGHVISSNGLSVVSTDAYHFDAAGLREFGKRYAATMVRQVGTTTSADRHEGPGADSWTLESSQGVRTVAFEAAQDRIEVLDPRGAVVASGSGTALALPRTARGVLLLRARRGAASTSAVLTRL